MVLGIVGKKGSGKDTFANFVRHHEPGYMIEHFADRLKEVCVKVFPVSTESLYAPELKEVPFDSPINIDSYLPELEDELKIELNYRNLTALNPRNLMQLIGTQYVRNTHGSYWTDYLKNKIQSEQTDEGQRRVIVSDVRFENEAETIQSFPDGLLLKIIRTRHLSTDRHASEKEQDEIHCPTLYLNENELYLSEMIGCLFAKGHWKQAFEFINRSLSRHPLDL